MAFAHPLDQNVQGVVQIGGVVLAGGSRNEATTAALSFKRRAAFAASVVPSALAAMPEGTPKKLTLGFENNGRRDAPEQK